MARYRHYGPRDEPPEKAGDRAFAGVNQRLAPELLPEGIVAHAINLRFRHGRPVPRGGAAKLPWLNNLDPHNLPGVIRPWANVYGAGKFSDPDELEWQILAADGAIWRTADSNSPVSIPMPPETRVTYPVNFTQAATVLLLWRGTQLAPLVMTSVDTGFQTITGGVENFSAGRVYDEDDLMLFPNVPNQAWDTTKVYGAGDLVLFTVTTPEAVLLTTDEGGFLTTDEGGFLSTEDVADTTGDNKHYVCLELTVAGESPETHPDKWALATWEATESYAAAAMVIFSSTRFLVAIATEAGESPLTSPEKFTLVESRVYAALETTLAGDSPTSAAAKWQFQIELTPAADDAIYVQNRLVVPAGRDTGLISDVLDYAFFQTSVANLRINQGESDRVVAFYKFNDTTIVAFKTNSVHVLANFYGTLADAYQDDIITEYGCVAAKSIAAVGSDLWFLSQRGLVSLRQTEQNKLQGVNLPVSDALQPTIERINWSHAAGSVAAYWDNKFYLAVPLATAPEVAMPMEGFHQGVETINGMIEGERYHWTPGNTPATFVNGDEVLPEDSYFTAQSNGYVQAGPGSEFDENDSLLFHVLREQNNAILVYDFLNQQWSGYDEGEAICPKFFFKALVNSHERLCFMGFDGYGNLYEEGRTDDVYDGSEDSELGQAEITTTLRTRLYQPADSSMQHWQEVELQVKSWNPSLSVTAIFPGINEEQSLWADWTRDRTAYLRPFNAPAYDATNAGDDHGLPDREDYSVPAGIYFGSGLRLEQHQDMTLRKRFRYHDTGVQIEIVNAQGSVELQKCFAEGRAGKRRKGVLN